MSGGKKLAQDVVIDHYVRLTQELIEEYQNKSKK